MEPIQNLLFRDSNKHIDALSFSPPQAKSLQNAKEMTNIPNFAVITGLNGSGKSHLLEYGDHELSQRERDINSPYRHVYLHANYDDMSMSDYDASERKRQLINQLYNEVKGKKLTDDKVLTSLREKLTNGEFLRDHSNFNVEQFLQNLKDSPIREIDNNLDYKTLEQLVEKYLPYYVSGNNPTSMLNAMARAYYLKRDNLLSQNPEASQLLDYATDNRELLFPGKYVDDASMIKDFRNIQGEVKEKYLKAKVLKELDDSPLKEINDILKKYQFNFELKENPNKGDRYQFWLQKLDAKGSLNLEPKDLSSGEKLILEMLAWFYYHSSEKPYDERRVSIMLLDEPDRHLDPKLIALFLQVIYEEFVKTKNVQIIMTTHRSDTVNLVPEESLFLLKPDETGISEVVPVHKEYALSRLFKNLRECTSIQLKVWTESTNDALFYTSIYGCIWDYSEEQRDGKQKRLIFKDLNGNEHSYHFLSRQYVLNFVSVSRENGTLGGWKNVLNTILLDQNISKSQEIKNKNKKKQTHARMDPRVHKSLGIVDNDGHREKHLENFKENNLQDRVVIPKESYSLENLLLDLLIFCAVLDPEKICKFISSKSSKDFSKICKKMNEVFEIIANPEVEIQDLQIKLQSSFDECFEFMEEVIDHNDSKIPSTAIKADLHNSWKEKCNVNILILGGLNRMITLQYPKKLLKGRGHDLFDRFIKSKEQATFMSQIVDGLSQKGLKFISQELAEVIFSLNDLAKKNCKTPKIRKVISTA